MTGIPTGDGDAVFTELAELREKLAALDARCATDHQATAHVTARVTALEAQVEAICSGLDTLEEIAAASPAPDIAAPEPPVGNTPHTSTEPTPRATAGPAMGLAELVIWVRSHVAQLIEKRIPQNQGRVRWCRSWWLHGEAIARFDALQRAWTEAITGDGNALVTYYEHLDRQLAALTDEDGPFAACRGGEHAHDTRTGPLGQLEPDPDFYHNLANLTHDRHR
ncbi:DUF4913 domain-containing protein [Pseudonocardia sp. EV170527-09]|uniref:DUF4913 domain-containing protein n=1 Tax=Pseudonocardia sp. EV170527-09 TaxID=2603411 RepID=UPI0011F32702|nr:DUF4913 domain-containing protein [Pseudonocardia sp. EV170527-09]KAA1011856.1 DUF4913 domain-containing protein [Pseudonocardia sp. EV170527-09]